MKKTVSFVGCRVRPFMENATLHGYAVYASDGFDDWDANRFGEVVYKSQKDFGCWDDVLRNYENLPEGPILFCGPVETEPDILEEAESHRRVINGPADAVRETRKLSFLSEMAVDGILMPEIFAMKKTSDGSGCIIKSLCGAGGTKIREDGGELLDGEYRQKLIDGVSIGASFITAKRSFRTALLGVTLHIMNDKSFCHKRFLFGGLLYPASINKTAVEAIKKFGQRVSRKSGLCGLWGADFILSGDEVYLLEINPRPTASMELIAMSHNIDIVSAQIAALEGEVNIDVGEKRKFLATAACYAKTDCRFELQEKWFELGARDIPKPGKTIFAGGPFISLYAESESQEDCMIELKKLAESFYGDVVEIS